LTLAIFLFALLLNLYFQKSILEIGTINNNLRVFLPLVVLAAGQSVVILTGGIDISVGSIVSIVSAVSYPRQS
jgi:ribose transport system permease protein